ncbi:hypothetical protein [Ornithinimicrobium cavernae]|uniref:hypothetical protein n=1 Tax=Ornithinimicrobium cavernae TaxID=2666047 RepID=UPI000D6906A2|nr:hypothetical protein [Ornithinimicrobium cavernae]
MLNDAIVILVVGAAALLLPLSSAYRSRLRRKLTRQAEATVPPEQEAALETRVTRRARAMGAGILLAGVAALLLSGLWDGADQASGGFFVLSIMFVAGAAGLALADIWWPGTTTDGPRTARATSPTAEDYLPPQSRRAAHLFAWSGLVALTTTLLLSRSEWFDAATVLHSPVPLLAVAIPVLLLLSWLATRRVLAAPQPARDEAELYWQDAVRAQTLTSLSVAAPFVGLFALVICGSVLDDAASTAAVAAGQVGPAWSLWLLIAGYVLPFALVLGVAAVATTRNGQWNEMRHYRERLWGGQPPRAEVERVRA